MMKEIWGVYFLATCYLQQSKPDGNNLEKTDISEGQNSREWIFFGLSEQIKLPEAVTVINVYICHCTV